jgi:enamine deaminase RidA (YjgF/YER057c/UK114 family)
VNEAQILADLDAILTRLIKDQIILQDLIDTGAMLNSIDVRSRTSRRGILIDILAVDYFVYVSGNYGVMDQVMRNSAWDNAIEDATTALLELSLGIGV